MAGARGGPGDPATESAPVEIPPDVFFSVGMPPAKSPPSAGGAGVAASSAIAAGRAAGLELGKAGTLAIPPPPPPPPLPPDPPTTPPPTLAALLSSIARHVSSCPRSLASAMFPPQRTRHRFLELRALMDVAEQSLAVGHGGQHGCWWCCSEICVSIAPVCATISIDRSIDRAALCRTYVVDLEDRRRLDTCVSLCRDSDRARA